MILDIDFRYLCCRSIIIFSNNLKITVKLNKMKNKINKDKDKEMAELFYNMYTGCVKFKKQKEAQNSEKKINCDEYYDKFKFFTEKYIEKK